MNNPKYSVKDILILARESGLPGQCIISMVNELLNPQSKLLGNEESPISKGEMLEVMHDVGYTEYDQEVGTNEQKGGAKKKSRKHRLSHTRRKT